MVEFLLIVKLFTGAQDEVTPARVDVTKVSSLQECVAKQGDVFKTPLPPGMHIRISTCEEAK